jgi:hypothetical protein
MRPGIPDPRSLARCWRWQHSARARCASDPAPGPVAGDGAVAPVADVSQFPAGVPERWHEVPQVPIMERRLRSVYREAGSCRESRRSPC